VLLSVFVVPVLYSANEERRLTHGEKTTPPTAEPEPE